ncbi:MAG: hypothetical protein AAGI71_14385 [Bacteroidota bacterium]
MRRLNFTLDAATIELLERLADQYYHGNKSQTVRAALESLAAHVGHDGWVVSGYTPVQLDDDASCYTCGEAHQPGDVLLRPVFERGSSPQALDAIPAEVWLDCASCAEENVSA